MKIKVHISLVFIMDRYHVLCEVRTEAKETTI